MKTLNWLEINRIIAELDLTEALIQQIFGPEQGIVVLELHKKNRIFEQGAQEAFKVLISVKNPFCWFCCLTRKLPNPEKPVRFTTFLRAHIKNGKITGATQVKDQRIIKLSVARNDITLILWIRLWGNAANIIVTDETYRILDCYYRRPQRGEISGGTYNPASVPTLETPPKSFALRVVTENSCFTRQMEELFHSQFTDKTAENLRTALSRQLEKRENTLLVRLTKISEQDAQDTNFFRWKEVGDLIQSNLHLITPQASWVRLEDFFNQNQPVTIELDPHLSPAANAQSYYRRYHKARARAERSQEEKAKITAELITLREQLAALKSGETADHLLSPAPKSLKKLPQNLPGNHFYSTDFLLILGKSSADNEELLRRHVKGNDLWLHTRDYPGAYVFIKTRRGKSVPLDTLLDAGNLAVFYSKAKASGQADVYYAQVKYLRRPKNGKKGLVIPTQEKNLRIKLDRTRLDRLFASVKEID